MASIASLQGNIERQAVSRLPRLGAIMLALIITAAGLAPVFSRDGGGALIDSGNSGITRSTPEQLTGSLSAVSGFAREQQDTAEQRRAAAQQAPQAAQADRAARPATP